jgi:hypothetical protein
VGVSTGIRVDFSALNGLLAELRRDVDQALAPSTRGTAQELGDIAKFGGSSASGEVIAGATDVSYAASIAAYNVGVHVDNAYAIANVIGFALAGYRAVDAVASSEFSASSTASTSEPAPVGSNGLTPVFVGPLPAPQIPVQALQPSPHALNWHAFDTPRMWTMVASEASEAAWAQMHAFRRLSELLYDQHRRMLAMRERLVSAWSPRGAGAEVLAIWDQHATALASDAMCADLTSKAMGGILQTLSDARIKMTRLYDDWRHITTDFMPEAWDHKAEKTNDKARVVMVEAEKAVGDYRKQIAVPDQALPVIVYQTESTIVDGSDTTEPGSSTGKPAPGQSRDPRPTRPLTPPFERPSSPPSLPGTQPVLDSPGLAGGTAPVPLSPVNPPSLLPIPPGASSVAPAGGAYVLPGPWVGAGRVLSMPSPSIGTGVSARPNAVSPNSGTHGLYGLPFVAGGRASTEPARQRMATEQWEVASGGPSVIGIAQPWYTEEIDEMDRDPLEQFEEWVKIVGLPWEAKDEGGRP